MAVARQYFCSELCGRFEANLSTHPTGHNRPIRLRLRQQQTDFCLLTLAYLMAAQNQFSALKPRFELIVLADTNPQLSYSQFPLIATSRG